MQQTRFIKLAAAVALAAGTLASGAARADQVYWQVGIDAPVDAGARIHTRVGNAWPRPVIVAPQPVVVAQAPVVVREPVVVQRPYCPERERVVVMRQPGWGPSRVVYAQPVAYRPWGWRHHHGEGWDRDWDDHVRGDRGWRDRDERRHEERDDRGHHGRD